MNNIQKLHLPTQNVLPLVSDVFGHRVALTEAANYLVTTVKHGQGIIVKGGIVDKIKYAELNILLKAFVSSQIGLAATQFDIESITYTENNGRLIASIRIYDE